MPCTPSNTPPPATLTLNEMQRLAADLAALSDQVTQLTDGANILADRLDALEDKAANPAPFISSDPGRIDCEIAGGVLSESSITKAAAETALARAWAIAEEIEAPDKALTPSASGVHPAPLAEITEENIVGNRVRFETGDGIGWAEYRSGGVKYTIEPAPPPSPEELAAETTKLQAYLQRQAADMRRLANLAQSAAGMADALAALTNPETVASLRWVGPEEERRRDDREDLRPFTAYLDDRVFAGDEASAWQRTGELAGSLCTLLTDRIFRTLAEHYDGYDAPLAAIAPIARAAIYEEAGE